MKQVFAVVFIVLGVFAVLRSHQLAEQFLTRATKLELWFYRPLRRFLFLFWVVAGIGFIIMGGGYLVGIFR